MWRDVIVVDAGALLMMQKTDCREWSARQLTTFAQTTPELAHWRHLQASFGRPPYPHQVFDANCFRYRHHLAPQTCYLDQVRQESIASYVLYRRLNELECRSDVDVQTPARSLRSAVDVDAASCSRWTGDHGQAPTIYRELEDQLSNGSYTLPGRL